MLCPQQFRMRQTALLAAKPLLAAMLAAAVAHQALGMIEGGNDNRPHIDPGWPEGAAAVFNTPERIAYWCGPMGADDRWHAEYRGDTKALNAVLADFAKLKVKHKPVVVHNGVGNSVWLNINNQPAKRKAAQMDWAFMVWESKVRAPDSPPGTKGDYHGFVDQGTPAQLDIYVGGHVRWDDVVIPKGLTVIDQRLEAHGFTLADGIVLEGIVVDRVTDKLLVAKVKLRRIIPKAKGPNGFVELAETTTDAQGRWTIKNAHLDKDSPVSWATVHVEAEGYQADDMAYYLDDQPRWHFGEMGLWPLSRSNKSEKTPPGVEKAPPATAAP